jgi:hypothetical protein
MGFKIDKQLNMKTRIIIIAVGLLVLVMPACLPTNENVNPDDPVTKFLGDWKVNESCRRQNYSVEIRADAGNTAPGYDPAVGLVVTNSVYVSSQTIGEGWTVSGKGTYQTDGTISWDYTLIIGASTYNCNAVFSK